MLFTLFAIQPASAESLTRDYSTSLGTYSFKSQRVADTDKAGLEAGAAVGWRRTFPSWYLRASAGFDWISIEGTNAFVTQKINQVGFLTDESLMVLLGRSRSALGLGLHNVIGQGAGLDYNSPNALNWLIHGGPRLEVRMGETSYALTLGYDLAINLPSGRANVFTIGFSMSEPNKSEEPQKDGPTLLTNAPNISIERPPEVKFEERLEPNVTKEVPERNYLSKARALLFSFNSDRLTPFAQAYLRRVAEALLSEHRDEWTAVEISSRNSRLENEGLARRRSNAIRTYLVRRGVPSERFKNTALVREKDMGKDKDANAADGPDEFAERKSVDESEVTAQCGQVRVFATHLGMVAYLESLEREYSDFNSVVEGRDSPSVLGQMKRHLQEFQARSAHYRRIFIIRIGRVHPQWESELKRLIHEFDLPADRVQGFVVGGRRERYLIGIN